MIYFQIFLLLFLPLIGYFIGKKNFIKYFKLIITLGSLIFASLIVNSFVFLTPVRADFFPELSFPESLLNFSLQVDPLSGILGLTVYVIGNIVTKYSIRYLEDDPNQNKFLWRLAIIQSSVITLIFCSNFIIFWLVWVFISYYLHQLLTHFSSNASAVKAAYQKFWISRLGDICMLFAAFYLYQVFHSFDFEVMSKSIQIPGFLDQNNSLLGLASVLIVLGAAIKSVQFPFHFWLPNTMETPTPVSALMHAGIINAGGYLIIRMSPILIHFPLILASLAVIGSISVFYATLAMSTQTDIKRHLAYSTIAQMGFMMLQCGLGAFVIATVHMIGHAFYKAYAFLSSGSVSDFGIINRLFPKLNPQFPSLHQSIFGALFAFGLLFACNSLSYFKPGSLVLIYILGLALAQILISSGGKLISSFYIVKITGLYFGLYLGMNYLLYHVLHLTPDFSTNFSSGLSAFIILLFTALYFIQNHLHELSKNRFGTWLYVQFYNGWYMGKI